jgi:hypothetical protein
MSALAKGRGRELGCLDGRRDGEMWASAIGTKGAMGTPALAS